MSITKPNIHNGFANTENANQRLCPGREHKDIIVVGSFESSTELCQSEYGSLDNAGIVSEQTRIHQVINQRRVALSGR